MPDTQQTCGGCGIFRAFGETYYSPNFSDPSKCGRAIRRDDPDDYDPDDEDFYDWDGENNNCHENRYCCQCAKKNGWDWVIFCRQCNTRKIAEKEEGGEEEEEEEPAAKKQKTAAATPAAAT